MLSKSTALFSLLSVLAVLVPVKSAPTILGRDLAVRSPTPEAVAQAQKLNRDFATAKPDDKCQPGLEACVNLQKAKCRDDQQWSVIHCSDNRFCFYIPENDTTSMQCLLTEDANKIFEDSGVPGGPKGLDVAKPEPVVTKPVSDIRKGDALEAQKMNGQFQNLHAEDTCATGSIACIGPNLDLATCISGKWAVSPCGGDLMCRAFPLIRANGTAVGCLTADDLSSRFAVVQSE